MYHAWHRGFDKTILTERKARLEATVADLEAERDNLTALLSERDISAEQAEAVKGLADKVRDGLQGADFALQRQIVDVLDVQARLCLEDGEKVAYVTCGS